MKRAFTESVVEQAALAPGQRDSRPGLTSEARSPKPDRAHGQGLPLEEALPIARQIAEALEAAHEHGVIHRDLEPANVKQRPDGVVKILDFGLAKALDNVSGGVRLQPDLTASPTISTPAMTRMGVILGTAAYMSPEQAKGRAADRRSDMWAFGCVLYEMLTGKRAFAGDDVSDTVANVLKTQPDWKALPQETSAPIRRLLRRCLAKDSKGRIGDASTARIEIDEAQSEPETAGQRVQDVARRRVHLAWASALALVTLMAASAMVWIRTLASSVPSPPETRLEINTPSTSDAISFAISPDGRRLVFVASGDGPSRLWQRPLEAVTAQPLAGTEGATYPFWSPDSRSVAFFANGKLKRLDIGRGPPQALANLSPGRGGTATLSVSGRWHRHSGAPHDRGRVRRLELRGVGRRSAHPGDTGH